MTTSQQDKLAWLKVLAEAAVGRPWHESRLHDGINVTLEHYHFIVAANPLEVLAMIARIEQLEAQLAEAKKLPVFHEAREMKRVGDQSVKIIFSSCRAASQFEKDVRAASVVRAN